MHSVALDQNIKGFELEKEDDDPGMMEEGGRGGDVLVKQHWWRGVCELSEGKREDTVTYCLVFCLNPWSMPYLPPLVQLGRFY